MQYKLFVGDLAVRIYGPSISCSPKRSSSLTKKRSSYLSYFHLWEIKQYVFIVDIYRLYVKCIEYKYMYTSMNHLLNIFCQTYLYNYIFTYLGVASGGMWKDGTSFRWSTVHRRLFIVPICHAKSN